MSFYELPEIRKSKKISLSWIKKSRIFRAKNPSWPAPATGRIPAYRQAGRTFDWDKNKICGG